MKAYTSIHKSSEASRADAVEKECNGTMAMWVSALLSLASSGFNTRPTHSQTPTRPVSRSAIASHFRPSAGRAYFLSAGSEV